MCLGIPGRIIEIRGDADLPMGVVDFGGVRREVCLAYVADEVEVGDYAIIHVGFAISKVDEDEARRCGTRPPWRFPPRRSPGRAGEVPERIPGSCARPSIG